MSTAIDSIAPPLLRFARPPARVRYARVGHAGQFELPRVTLEEDWGTPWLEDASLCFRRVTRDVTTAPRIVEDALVVYDSDGLNDAGTYDLDGKLTRWTPIQRVLPVVPVADATWTETHTRGQITSERTVVVLACPDHPGCLVSVAETRRDEGVMVLRTHFGDGDGYGGYEALIQVPGRPTVRTWTEAVTVETRSAAKP